MGGKGSFTGIDQLSVEDMTVDLKTYVALPVKLYSSAGACIYVNGLTTNGNGMTTPFPPDYVGKIHNISDPDHDGKTTIVIKMDHFGYSLLHLINTAASKSGGMTEDDFKAAQREMIEQIAAKGVTTIEFFWRCIGRYASA